MVPHRADMEDFVSDSSTNSPVWPYFGFKAGENEPGDSCQSPSPSVVQSYVNKRKAKVNSEIFQLTNIVKSLH